MTNPRPQWRESDQKVFAAHWQPALLIDLLVARDISSHKILRGTGLFYDDLSNGDQQMSAQQLLQLIKNARQLDGETDLGFRWGSVALPGHCGSFSQLLANAGNLQQFISLLSEYSPVFTPLISPRVYQDQQSVYLHWIPASGAAEHQSFMVEMAMSAVTSACRWLHGEHLPWRYSFSHAQPEHIEQYYMNLGDQLQFNVGIDVMMIDRAWLEKNWQRPQGRISLTAEIVLQEDCEAQWQAVDNAPLFAEVVYRWLLAHVKQSPCLEVVAEAFCMSPATFKRKLKKHHTSFQQLQDQMRLHTSLYLFHIQGWSNEQVANYLKFNDTTNFRRAFKRWSGFTPSDSKLRFSF